MSLPIKPSRPFSETKKPQYIKTSAIPSNAVDRLKQKINETQSQWSGLMAKTISLEHNLIQLRDSVSNTLKNRGESVTIDRYSKDSTSSKSTNQPEVFAKSHSGPVKADLNSSFYNIALRTNQLTPQVQKINQTSRLASPMQSKKVANFKTVQHKANETPLTMTLSRINFENKFQQSFANKTSLAWFPKQGGKLTSFESLPQFRIGKLLGRGQFSEVFMCIDKGSGMVFALKVIKKAKIQDIQLQRQLIQEIAVQSQLCHPNIVRLYNFYQDQANIYLLQEYCDGELFKHQRKQHQQKFSESIAAQFIEQIGKAIEYLHEMRAMHRDLKSENIMLQFVSVYRDRENQIKLGDFGCVCSSMQRRDTFCGTIEFMAPEVIKLQGYDKRVDAWQLAVLAYELVHGITPFVQFGCRDQNIIMQNIIRVTLKPKQNQIHIPNYFSPELQNFIKGGLQSDPERRLSIQQMMNHPWILKHKSRVKPDFQMII